MKSEQKRASLGQDSAYNCALTAFADAVLEGRDDVAPYTNNYLGVHRMALGNIYLCVKEVLGDGSFAALAGVYVKHFPASQWDVNRYGERFSELLAAQVNGVKADAFDWPAIAALAAIEYAITEQYYADNDLKHGGEPTVIEAEATVQLHQGWIHRLAALHPYADIAARLSFESSVAVWREDLRIKVMPVDLILDTGDGPS